MSSRYRIGIDIGGTFTDIVVFDKEIGDFKLVKKISTTPADPSRAVIEALRGFSRDILDSVEFIIHATTIATNALLGQEGLELPRTALITTKGFRDILEIGRQRRPELYNLFFERPKSLIPRHYRFEIDERMNHNGDIIKGINIMDLDKIVERLIKHDIKSVAVSLLHSYANPEHEKIIENELIRRIKSIYISVSHKVDPEHREFERTSTTVINAVLMPIVTRYLRNLEKKINNLTRTKIFIMQSSGGIESIGNASRLPVSIIESGPASGVMATKYLLEIIGRSDALSFDMGGTTAKAGAVINFQPIITTEYEVGGKVHVGRIIKGSGYPIRFPFIDLAEVSAGGGSIIWVDEGGALRVGPISAGAEPGPACYGKGGEKPTITDAHLILGRLNKKYLLDGDLKIYFDLAKESFRKNIYNLVNLDPVEAAIGALKIANSLMSKIMRIVSVERGINPSDLILVAFGGAGPMHACSLAEELNMKEILIPRSPGLFSAIGLLSVDFKHTLIKSIRKTIDSLSFDELENIFRRLEETGKKILLSEGISKENMIFNRFIDARYLGQGYELIIPANGINSENYAYLISNRFHNAHERKYGYSLVDEKVEVVNARLDVIGLINKPKLRLMRTRKNKAIEPFAKREAYFESIDEFIEVPVFKRIQLSPGVKLNGPVIIEQYDSTIIVEEDWQLIVDNYGNLLITKQSGDN